MLNKSINNFGSAFKIWVKDHFEKHWSTYFTGWTIQNLENGVVLLKAANIDQAGLHGALNKIRDLNLTLLSLLYQQCFSQFIL